jgi:hypothetical protein
MPERLSEEFRKIRSPQKLEAEHNSCSTPYRAIERAILNGRARRAAGANHGVGRCCVRFIAGAEVVSAVRAFKDRIEAPIARAVHS